MPRRGLSPLTPIGWDARLRPVEGSATIEEGVADLAALLQASEGVRAIIEAGGLAPELVEAIEGLGIPGYQNRGTHRGQRGVGLGMDETGDLGLGRWGLVGSDGSGAGPHFSWEWDPLFDLQPPGSPPYDDNAPLLGPLWPQTPPRDEDWEDDDRVRSQAEIAGGAQTRAGLRPQGPQIQEPAPERNTTQIPRQEHSKVHSSRQEAPQEPAQGQAPIGEARRVKPIDVDPTTAGGRRGVPWLRAIGRADLAGWGSPKRDPRQILPTPDSASSGPPPSAGFARVPLADEPRRGQLTSAQRRAVQQAWATLLRWGPPGSRTGRPGP